MADIIIENLPDVTPYERAVNSYNPDAYPAHKKITAEEWNALMLSGFAQGNRQEKTLEDIINGNITALTERSNFHSGLFQDHENRIVELEEASTDYEARINDLELDVPTRALKTETVLKYDVTAPIPTGVTFNPSGLKTVLVEFYNQSYNVPVSGVLTEERLGSVTAVKLVSNGDGTQTQYETFRFENGIVGRSVVLNDAQVITTSPWAPINDQWIAEINSRITSAQTQINSLLEDYVRKQDNADPLVQSVVGDITAGTNAFRITETVKDIRVPGGVATRSHIAIPVVDNRGRLILPGEITNIRDLISWRNSLAGSAITFAVDFSDMPIPLPVGDALQAYLMSKWNDLGGQIPILDQTIMEDPSQPLSYKWFVNDVTGPQDPSNPGTWLFLAGTTNATAGNNVYDDQGVLISAGSPGTVVGTDVKKFYGFVETNGEFTLNGMDDLEGMVIDNKAAADFAIQDLTTNKRARILDSNQVYATNANGQDIQVPYATAAVANTLAMRQAGGALTVATPQAATDAATKQYVDNMDNQIMANYVPTSRTVAGKALTANIALENLTIQRNGVSVGTYNPAVAAVLNITVPTTPAQVGAEPAFTKNTAFNRPFSTSTPLQDGTASAGTTTASGNPAAGNHRHPLNVDTTIPPASNDTTGAVGTATTYARRDHKHPIVLSSRVLQVAYNCSQQMTGNSTIGFNSSGNAVGTVSNGSISWISSTVGFTLAANEFISGFDFSSAVSTGSTSENRYNRNVTAVSLSRNAITVTYRGYNSSNTNTVNVRLFVIISKLG